MDIGQQDPQAVLGMLRGILGSTDDIISLIDQQGRFIFVNKVVTGITMEQVIGTEVASYVPEQYKQTVVSSIEKCLATNQPVSYETVGAGPDGTSAYYFCRLSPCTLDGKPVVLCMGTDVTRYKTVENDLQERIRELEVITQATLDREAKMMELKKEVEDLKKAQS